MEFFFRYANGKVTLEDFKSSVVILSAGHLWTLAGTNLNPTKTYTKRESLTRKSTPAVRDAHNQRNRNRPVDFDYYKIAPSDSDRFY
jgi:hypothetical protein